nr:hypothetical protein [Pandoravirus aubagnensis]
MQDSLLAISRLAVRDVPRHRPRPSDFDTVKVGDDGTVRARTRRRLDDGNAPRWKRKRVDDTLPLRDRRYIATLPMSESVVVWVFYPIAMQARFFPIFLFLFFYGARTHAAHHHHRHLSLSLSLSLSCFYGKKR